eukprot:g61441.t1
MIQEQDKMIHNYEKDEEERLERRKEIIRNVESLPRSAQDVNSEHRLPHTTQPQSSLFVGQLGTQEPMRYLRGVPAAQKLRMSTVNIACPIPHSHKAVSLWDSLKPRRVASTVA